MKDAPKSLERPPAIREAFSYIRFSSKSQADGASLERQLTGTRAYCEENNLILNETLTFKDLGVSAFKGDNLAHGLGDLLQACEDRLIPRGSAIVVESLDRLSRQRPRAVSTLLGLFLDKFGLEVHLTGIRKVLLPESKSAAEEGMDLLYVAMLAIRASEEQETKAARLSDAFRRKRDRVSKGEALLETNQNKLPWWVVHNPETGKLESPAERATTVKLIFKWASEGVTSPEIARRLDAKSVPTWRPRADRWSPSRIRHLILSDSALGVLESTARSKAIGQDFKVAGYYPVLINAELAAKARQALSENSRYGRGNGVPTPDTTERPHNILRGLIKIEGHASRYDCRKNGAKGAWIGYYYGYDEMNKKNLGVVSSRLLEPTLIAGLRELRLDDLKPEVDEIDPATVALADARRRLADGEKSLQRILSAIEKGGELDSLLKRLSVLEREKADLQTNVDTLERKVRSTQVIGNGKVELEEMVSVLDADLTDNTMRSRMAQAIRRVVSRIDVTFEPTKKGKGLLFRGMVEDGYLVIPDPCPPKKTRKPLYIVVHLRHGGKRAIFRLPQDWMDRMQHSNVIFSARA
jgi:DNA invertase Pin-like site-specific DNA recombinase